MSNTDGFYTKVVGVSHKNEDGSSRQKIIKDYASENKYVILEREPNNKFDKNAVAVFIEAGFLFSHGKYQLGYLDGRTAEDIAPLIDSGVEVKAYISSITGLEYGNGNVGVNLFIEMKE